jgi:hypothetical protein
MSDNIPEEKPKRIPKFWVTLYAKKEVHPVYAAFEERAGWWCPAFNGHFRLDYNLFETEGQAYKSLVKYLGEVIEDKEKLLEKTFSAVSSIYHELDQEV